MMKGQAASGLAYAGAIPSCGIRRIYRSGGKPDQAAKIASAKNTKVKSARVAAPEGRIVISKYNRERSLPS
jgi:hypothetical protein